MIHLLFKVLMTVVFVTVVLTIFSAAQTRNRADFNGTWKLEKKQLAPSRDVMVENKSGDQEFSSASPVIKPFPAMKEMLIITFNEPEFTVEARIVRDGNILVQKAKTSDKTGGEVETAPFIAGYNPLKTFYTDGRTVKQNINSEITLETKARVEEGKIIVEEDMPLGGKSVQIYELSPDGQRLFLTSEIIGSADSAQKMPPVRLVYRRIEMVE